MKGKQSSGEALDNLERVEGVAAVPPGPRAEVSTFAARKGPPDVTDDLLRALPAQDIDRFRKAGWSFVEDGARSADDNLKTVFKDGDGHIKIDSGSLNVRFAKGVSEHEIDQVLRAHGLAIQRKLGFAPNLFIVRPDRVRASDDSIETARSLGASEKVDYAEPVLIEALSGR